MFFSVEATLKHPSNGDLLHAQDDEQNVLTDIGPEYPYEPDKKYSRLNFLLMPQVSEQIWHVIDNYKGDVPIKSLPSLVLEELFEEMNWMDIFKKPILESGSEDTVSNKIIKYTLNVAKTYLKEGDKILWYMGDRGRASTYKVTGEKGLYTIDCYYKNQDDYAYSKYNRTAPGKDLLVIDASQYTVLIANYVYFDNEPEILEIYSQMSSINKALLYVSLSPDETDILYEGLDVEQSIHWFPDADAIRNGFKIITKPDRGRVWTWCSHGKQSDRIWSSRKGHYNFPMYEMTQRIEKGGFSHTALKHFMFSILDTNEEVKKYYTYPKDFFEAKVVSSYLYHHDTVDLIPVSLPDSRYMCCYVTNQGKVHIKFFDIDLDLPYFVRYRYLQRFVFVYQGDGGYIDPMASYEEVRLGYMTNVKIDFSPIIFFGYGWNYALDALVFDQSKEGLLILNYLTRSKEPEWRDCDFDDGVFSLVTKGRYKVYLPQSFSMLLTDGNFRIQSQKYAVGAHNTDGHDTSVTLNVSDDLEAFENDDELSDDFLSSHFAKE